MKSSDDSETFVRVTNFSRDYEFRMGLCVVALLGFAPTVRAGLPLIPAADELRQCAYASARADRVVFGRIAGVEADTVKAKPVRDVTHQITYRIYRLAAIETLAGGKATTEVRLGGPVAEGPVAIGPEPSQYPDPVAKDAEGLYFLQLHHTGEFYTLIHFVPKYIKETFERDVKRAKRYLGLLADSDASLRSKEPEDRLATAVLLLMRYQAYRLNTHQKQGYFSGKSGLKHGQKGRFTQLWRPITFKTTFCTVVSWCVGHQKKDSLAFSERLKIRKTSYLVHIVGNLKVAFPMFENVNWKRQTS